MSHELYASILENKNLINMLTFYLVFELLSFIVCKISTGGVVEDIRSCEAQKSGQCIYASLMTRQLQIL